MSSELVPRDLGPGLVPTGFAEAVLDRVTTIDDPRILYDSSADLSGLAQKWNGHGQEKSEIKSAQMFCEVRLGQLLGPNPGQGSRSALQVNNFARAQSDLPAERVKDFRRFFGHFNPLVEAVRDGKRSRRSLLLLVDQWEAEARSMLREETGLPPEPLYSELEIRCGDFRNVLTDIDTGSVALILTDPPYPGEYLPLWSDLGEWAAKHLIEGGSLIAYCGQSILPDALRRLDEHLRYWWTVALIHGQSQAIPGKWVSAGWKPLLWFVHETRGTRTMLADTVQGGTPRKTLPTGDDGSWAQATKPLEPIISALTAPGDLIVDPFAGSGTVGLAAARFGRRFIGAELS